MNQETQQQQATGYLWDCTSPPGADADVARIERVLAPLRFEPGAPPAFPAPGAGGSILARLGRPLTAMAAAVILAVGGWLWLRGDSGAGGGVAAGSEPMEVVCTEGAPIVAGRALSASAALREGDWIQTDGSSLARINVGALGIVDVDYNTRVRVRRMTTGEQRLELAHGRIDALINAPPRLFIVDTPVVTAVDLGCDYTLEIERNGDGVLNVTYGWVSLEPHDGRPAVVVPGDARCEIDGERGPGVPYFSSARPEFVAAAKALAGHSADGASDENESDGDDDYYEELFEQLLESLQPRDTLTIWYLFPSLTESQRARTLDALGELQPLPANVTPEALIALDKTALDAWREALEKAW